MAGNSFTFFQKLIRYRFIEKDKNRSLNKVYQQAFIY